MNAWHARTFSSLHKEKRTAGDRTHDQFERTIHRQSGLHRRGNGKADGAAKRPRTDARRSELPISDRAGTTSKTMRQGRGEALRQAMANASKKHVGAGSRGKGSGARTRKAGGDIGENDVLSNRDKQQHTRERGQAGKVIQAEQLQDAQSNQGGE